MRLNRQRILRVGKNLQQFVITKKVETWEHHPFGFQVISQTFLNYVQNMVGIFQTLVQFTIRAVFYNLQNYNDRRQTKQQRIYVWIITSPSHNPAPGPLHRTVLLAFGRKLNPYILTGQNRLQIHPLPVKPNETTT